MKEQCFLYGRLSVQGRGVTDLSRDETEVSPLLVRQALSSLKIIDRSFRCVSPRLWTQLPDSFRQPRPRLSLPDSSPLYDHVRKLTLQVQRNVKCPMTMSWPSFAPSLPYSQKSRRRQ